MVFYECVITAKNTAPFYQLTSLMKEISLKVVENGGIVRSVQNHGIRDLAHRFRARHPDRDGTRLFQKGRFISVYYDSSPAIQEEVGEILVMDENVLRATHLRARNKLDTINNPYQKKNPYVRRVVQMEEAKKEKEESVLDPPDNEESVLETLSKAVAKANMMDSDDGDKSSKNDSSSSSSSSESDDGASSSDSSGSEDEKDDDGDDEPKP
uniref:30S ribosomal protein S6 n=1 Tax=Grammatophora oceanica TaxID=210454 RepID=A0A7S1YM88_9STRA|mmetsp:Transcript_5842/g.8305  ORF Transcript_5842/g.8305 Transcript_5842/m.8305 type:complete len:211 (+) Transcript_5842:3-635(+)